LKVSTETTHYRIVPQNHVTGYISLGSRIREIAPLPTTTVSLLLHANIEYGFHNKKKAEPEGSAK